MRKSTELGSEFHRKAAAHPVASCGPHPTSLGAARVKAGTDPPSSQACARAAGLRLLPRC